ncbi:sel1 repeat family protein, partial [Salmonella enterica]|nr:sel1 repeat family protein [Salmonella enterica]
LADTGSTAQAREVLLPLADQGDREAQYRLGCLLMADRTPDSRRQAVDRMTRAATAGLAVAQRTLGDWLLNGSAGTRDPAAALVWYRKAAEQGNALAALNTGNAYWTGSGVRANAGVAMAWYVLAEHNARPAESAVRRLAQQMRVRAMMLSATRGRLSAARALAEQYLRRYGRPGVPVTPFPGGA